MFGSARTPRQSAGARAAAYDEENAYDEEQRGDAYDAEKPEDAYGELTRAEQG